MRQCARPTQKALIREAIDRWLDDSIADAHSQARDQAQASAQEKAQAEFPARVVSQHVTLTRKTLNREFAHLLASAPWSFTVNKTSLVSD